MHIVGPDLHRGSEGHAQLPSKAEASCLETRTGGLT
jgi:hypothetical protein